MDAEQLSSLDPVLPHRRRRHCRTVYGIWHGIVASEWSGRCLAIQLLFGGLEGNSFLERVYPARRAFQLAYQVTRCRQLSGLHPLDVFHAIIVADYSLGNDRVLAQLHLMDDYLRPYHTRWVEMSVSLIWFCICSSFPLVARG